MSDTLKAAACRSAFMGLDVMQSAYSHAISEGYRFYSYGDSSLLLPQRPK